MRSLSYTALALVALSAAPPLARAENGRTTPGLVIETGTRTAYCDQLMFTPDGGYLLAVGEDKVVRRWRVGADGAIDPQSINVRWPILREARGSIFAAAFDRTGERLAFAGYGLKTGLVATARLSGGRVGMEAVSDPRQSFEVNWAVAFSPTDRYVVYGNETGELYRWDTSAGKSIPSLFAGSKAATRPPNRVRLIGFLDDNRFFSVAMDGQVRLWDVRSPDAAPSVLKSRFEGPAVFRAVYHKGRGVVVASSTPKVGPDGKVLGGRGAGRDIEVIDVVNDRELGSLRVPEPKGGNRTIRSLAIDRDGTHVAVGCQELPDLDEEGDFYRLTRGSVVVADLTKLDRKDSAWGKPLPTGYLAEAVAFHPLKPNLLASAGGDNHELRLWDTTTGQLADGQRAGASQSVVRGPANCVWAVAFDRKGKYFAWKDLRSTTPTHPNALAAADAPWRIFDIAGRGGRQILASPPADFAPTTPINAVDGWAVKPIKGTTTTWRVTGPGGIDVKLDDENKLYKTGFNQEPRCWTFVKAARKPLRLAVGHQWGISVYECTDAGVKLVRVMSGHEGQVMCLAPSADGELLISGSRDQSVCFWSLGAWTAGNEMGARFEVKAGKLVVADVDAGSPAWEPLNPMDGTDREASRLAKGDTLDLLLIYDESFAYDPVGDYEKEVARGHINRSHKTVTRNAGEALAKLKAIRPAQEYLMAKRRPGEPDLIYKLTTVRQRPLLRFFATRADHLGGGREWAIWRPRDFFYDTSANGDQFVGWHVNSRQLNEPPAFYPLERFRGTDHVAGPKGAPSGFHRPDKIWPFVMRAVQEPEKVIFTEIEPPRVALRLVEVPKGTKAVGGAKVGTKVEIEVSIASVDNGAADQLLKHMNVFLNDHKDDKAKLAPSILGRFKPTTVSFAAADLAWGRNVVKVDCVNARGGRGEATIRFDYEPAERPTANLHALIVGINDYGKTKGAGEGVPDLQCAAKDAAEIARVLKQHKASRNFAEAYPVLIPQKEATAANIVAKLREMAKRVKPDDWFMVYLAGHGYGDMQEDKDGKKTPKPGTFFFVTVDCDVKKPETLLTSKKLYEELMKVKCRKMLMLDTCHSGAAAADAPLIPADQLRDLTREGKRLLVLSSCQASQQALEPSEPSERFKHGFFTHALLNIITDADKGTGKVRQVRVTSGELNKRLAGELAGLLKAIGADKSAWQQPAFSDADPSEVSVLCRPLLPASGAGERRKK